MLSLDNLINFTHTILLKHTDCGTLILRDEKIKAQLKERVAGSGMQEKEVEAMRFGENTIRWRRVLGGI